ncbi:MAG: PAS domain-containing protein [Candidatus Sumerlaeia bacterium]
MGKNIYVYEVDAEDKITSVSDNWEPFARENAWLQGTCRKNIIGQSMWSFIHDPETRMIYKYMHEAVRSGKKIGPIPFRCDSPRERRYLELIMRPLDDGHIEITSRIVKTEKREYMPLLEKERENSDERLRICSMCKKIATDEGEWLEIEDYVSRFALFERDTLPTLSHSLCPDCQEATMNQIESELADAGRNSA